MDHSRLLGYSSLDVGHLQAFPNTGRKPRAMIIKKANHSRPSDDSTLLDYSSSDVDHLKALPKRKRKPRVTLTKKELTVVNHSRLLDYQGRQKQKRSLL